jgi:uncharacterized membrane protein
MNWFLLAIISAVFSAAAAIFQKKILFNIEALDFSLILSFFNVILSIPFLINVNYAALSSSNLLVLYLKSILGALAFLCVMLSIKNMEISKALPLLALTPGFVAIFAFVFINDSLSFLQVFAILLLLSGTYILETRSGQKLLDPFKVFVKSKNHHYVVFALILFTTTSIIDRLLLYRYQLSPNAFIGFQHIFFAVNFLIIYLIFKKNIIRLFKLNSKYLWYLVILISILTVVYRYTEILAVKIAPVAMVLSVKRISIFFAVLIGGKIFKEKNLLIKTIATVLIIAGIILITR